MVLILYKPKNETVNQYYLAIAVWCLRLCNSHSAIMVSEAALATF